MSATHSSNCACDTCKLRILNAAQEGKDLDGSPKLAQIHSLCVQTVMRNKGPISVYAQRILDIIEASEASAAKPQQESPSLPPEARECWVLYRDSDGMIIDISATREEVKDCDGGYTWVRMVEATAVPGKAQAAPSRPMKLEAFVFGGQVEIYLDRVLKAAVISKNSYFFTDPLKKEIAYRINSFEAPEPSDAGQEGV